MPTVTIYGLPERLADRPDVPQGVNTLCEQLIPESLMDVEGLGIKSSDVLVFPMFEPRALPGYDVAIVVQGMMSDSTVYRDDLDSAAYAMVNAVAEWLVPLLGDELRRVRCHVSVNGMDAVANWVRAIEQVATLS